jgi:hypothetical protein
MKPPNSQTPPAPNDENRKKLKNHLIFSQPLDKRREIFLSFSRLVRKKKEKKKKIKNQTKREELCDFPFSSHNYI